MPSRPTLSLVTGTAIRCRTLRGWRWLVAPVPSKTSASAASTSTIISASLRRISGFFISAPPKARRKPRLAVDDHLGELAPHQRLVDQCPAERASLPGVTQRLDQRTTRVG